MEIYHGTEQWNNVPSAVIIGKFDGVHIGHRALVKKLMSVKGMLKSVVLTFDRSESIKEVVNDKPLCSEERKQEIFQSLGLESMVIYPLTKENAMMSPEEFVRKVLVEGLNCKVIVCGRDFRFGKDREGDISKLAMLSFKYDFRLYVIEKEQYENEAVSSTRIRETLNINKEAAMYMLSGESPK